MKCLFPIYAYVVWYPTRSKNLGRSLSKREPAKNETHTTAVQYTVHCLSETPSFGKDKSFAWTDWLWYEKHASSKSYYSYPLLICTWFLKNQFWKIQFDKLDFKSISNWIFTACAACKNPFQNWFLQAKNPVCRTWFLQLDFSEIKYRSTGGQGVFKNQWIFSFLCK